MENWKDYEDLFEPFENLIEIEVEGKILKVPENNNLLRCFQFIALESISMGDFCWNRDCANCQVWIEDHGAEKPVLACRTKVEDKMKIVRLAEEIKI
jgi:NADH dehydrogenase/NADH:ubiquinone oxidoreductase subunit G